MALIHCPHCGQTMSDRAPQCPHCGYRLQATQPATSQNPAPQPANRNGLSSGPQQRPAYQPEPPRRGSGSNVLVPILILVLLSAIAGVIYLWFSGHRNTASAGPEDSAASDSMAPSASSGNLEARRDITVGDAHYTMVLVSGGTFSMGGTPEQGGAAQSDEYPVHSVTLSPYYIGQTEVTQALWQAVMGSNPSVHQGASLPVENVSWNDCQEFISRLNATTGKQFRLPTEAEWEFAARGGTQSQGYRYSGSNSLGAVAWYGGNAGGATHPVATKRPNELGLYDMSGNVYEWTSDHYGDYDAASVTDPTSSSPRTDYVLRGGCWRYKDKTCRVSFRSNHEPYDANDERGLRLVLVP